MSRFAIDHVVVRVPDPDALAMRISQTTRLPVLRGWTPGGVIRSRGVRFVNGPFLDIHAAPEPQPAWLGLSGPLAEAERLANEHGWRTRPAEEDARVPWRILLFRRGQGALTALFVIDYDLGSPLWATREFSGELFRQSAGGQGARLVRITVAAPDHALELSPLVSNDRLVVCAGEAAEVVRLEIEGFIGPPLAASPSLTLTAA